MKIIRTSTVPGSINVFCKGLLSELKSEGYQVTVISSPGPDLEEISEREKVNCIAVNMKRHIAPWDDLKSLIKLIKVFHQEKPVMVHSITPKAGLLSMLAAWFCRIPVRLHTFTGLIFPTATGLKQKILIATDRLTCACATHIMPEGEGVKHDLERFNITKKPLKVLGYGNIRGIDLKWYNPELSEIKQEAEKIRKLNLFTFIFVGRLVGDKGINELVEAFLKLNKKHSETRLILVGAEEQHLDPLKPQTIIELKENPRIEAVGRQNDVRPWLAASDVFVFPSYREGFPNVVIEAGAMELPAIVTDINGSREIIQDGINGLVIPSKDADMLYKAMKSLLISPTKLTELKQNTRQMIASRFEQGYVQQCLKAYYRSILPKV